MNISASTTAPCSQLWSLEFNKGTELLQLLKEKQLNRPEAAPPEVRLKRLGSSTTERQRAGCSTQEARRAQAQHTKLAGDPFEVAKVFPSRAGSKFHIVASPGS